MPLIPAPFRKMISRLFRQDFVRFCIVGALGFLINLAFLSLLFRALRWPVIVAQLASAEVAYLSNFFLHHSWTYAQRSDKTIGQLLSQFHMSVWSGLLLSTLIVYAMVDILHQNYIEGLVVASALVLFWNYFWTKFYIWRHGHGHKVVVESTKPGS